MISVQRITVHSPLDIVNARMQVREVARKLGLSLTDQARISMATSSLASSMGFDESGNIEGYIDIEGLRLIGRKGIKVTCRRIDCTEQEKVQNFIASQRWMVDEVKLLELSSSTIEVSIVKWAER